jgi:hypothetical protein
MINKNEISDKNIEELNEIIRVALERKKLILRKTSFPYIDIFSLSTNSGEEVEKLLSNEIFIDLCRVSNQNHDHTTKNTKKLIETKMIRMMVKGLDSYENRAISILDKDRGCIFKTKKYGGKISTTTFQQIKPKEFEYLLCVILFKDGMDIFLLPSNMISPSTKSRVDGMAYISGQHKGNYFEGQLNYNDEVLSKHYLLSIYNNGEMLYFFDRDSKKIKNEYIKKSIEDIINEKFGFQKHCE